MKMRARRSATGVNPHARGAFGQARPLEVVRRVALALVAHGWRLACAESCTGGLIAAACTELAGSSAWFDRGFVTYSNEAKMELLGVEAALLAEHGAVSEAVACAMAAGALQRSNAHICVAVTGIAGPGGAVPGKPVGTVWLGWALRRSGAEGQAQIQTQAQTEVQVQATRLQLRGSRHAIRQATVERALRQVLALST